MRRGRKRKPYTEIDVVDLFCGIGGLSYGMKSKGFHIQGGFDLDKTCRFAYEYNNDAPFFYRDIKNVSKRDIKPLYKEGAVRILVVHHANHFLLMRLKIKRKMKINMICFMSLEGWLRKLTPIL